MVTSLDRPWAGDDRSLPPTVTDRWQAALDREIDRDDRRVVFVCGPPGYGKTRLIERWAAEQRSRGRRVASVTSPAEPRAILEALDRAVAELGEAPAGDRRTSGRHRGERSDEADLASVLATCAKMPTATVVLEITGTHQPLAIVADLAARWLDDAMAHLTLVIATRARPPGELAPLMIQGLIGLLDEQVLELRPSEVVEILEARAGTSPAMRTIEQIQDLAAGWPLGVSVLGAVLDDPPGTLDAALELLVDCLEVELIQALPDDQRQVLPVLALFERFVPELIGHLAEEPDADLQAFRDLRAASCFIRPSGKQGWLVLHPMLRAALRRSPHQLEPARRRQLLERAARWFIDEGSPIDAAWCHRWLGDWRTGGEILTSHLATILRTDQLDELLEITKELPIPLQVENLTWSMGIAWLEISTGRLPAGLARLEMLERYCDEDHLKQLLALRAASAPFRHDPEPALHAAERDLELLARRDPDDTFEDVFLVLRTTHFQAQVRANALVAGAYLGEWERVVEHDVPLDPVTASELSSTTRYGILARRATYGALAGDHVRASALAAEARLLRDARDDVVVTARGQAELAEAAALRARGFGSRATKVLDAMEPLPSEAPNRHAWLAVQRADLACDAGEPGCALEMVARPLRVGSVPPAPLLRSLLASAGARAKLLLHDPDGAVRLLAGAPETFYTRWWRILGLLAAADLKAAAARLAAWPDESVPGSRVRRALAHAALAEMRATPADADQLFATAARDVVRFQAVAPLLELGPTGRVLVGRADRADPVVAELTRMLPAAPSPVDDQLLTPAESRIMAHLAQELTMREIADRLHLSVNTVKSHVRRIYRKLDARGRAEAVGRWTRAQQR